MVETMLINYRAGLLLLMMLALAPVARADAPAGTAPVVVRAGSVEARIALSADHAVGGHRLGVAVEIAVAPGWHVYGEPLPAGEGLMPISITFDRDLVAQQKLKLPSPTPLKFEALNETYPVYQGSFKAAGDIVLAQNLKPGDYSIAGTLNFQECNDAICKMPQSVRFALPIKID
jgi:DsbC/DsbD-like thiol-disulfide interchange protein